MSQNFISSKKKKKFTSKIKLGCSQHKKGEAGQGLSNKKKTQQAQSAEAEKQCASSSDKLHKPQPEPELIQTILHQGIIQQLKYWRFDNQLYFPRREILLVENLKEELYCRDT